MVFFGEYELSVTNGGRVVLPKKLRELLQGGEFVLTRGFDQCLAGYNKADWEVRAQALLQVSLLEKENLEKRRLLFSSAVYLEIDEQGRFVLPKNLALHGVIKEKVIIIGVGDHFEIWDSETWKQYAEKIHE
ncbi:division/cell wall cluster transcriptional repressor MraZ [Candidatus Roizmanbacteria bacterium]|nr:division/cell wall cluster transcriptional repressor MraZ [Candidatus Roizmanbacteria bacterium]